MHLIAFAVVLMMIGGILYYTVTRVLESDKIPTWLLYTLLGIILVESVYQLSRAFL